MRARAGARARADARLKPPPILPRFEMMFGKVPNLRIICFIDEKGTTSRILCFGPLKYLDLDRSNAVFCMFVSKRVKPTRDDGSYRRIGRRVCTVEISYQSYRHCIGDNHVGEHNSGPYQSCSRNLK